MIIKSKHQIRLKQGLKEIKPIIQDVLKKEIIVPTSFLNSPICPKLKPHFQKMNNATPVGVAQLVGALSSPQEDFEFNSQSGQIPRLCV